MRFYRAYEMSILDERPLSRLSLQEIIELRRSIADRALEIEEALQEANRLMKMEGLSTPWYDGAQRALRFIRRNRQVLQELHGRVNKAQKKAAQAMQDDRWERCFITAAKDLLDPDMFLLLVRETQRLFGDKKTEIIVSSDVRDAATMTMQAK